jgi:hypothetical protein
MRYIREFAAYVVKPIQPTTLELKDKSGKVLLKVYIDVDMLGNIRKTIKGALMSQPIFHKPINGQKLYDKRTVSTPQGQIITEYVAMMPNNITVLHRIVYKALRDGHVIDNAQDLLDYIQKNVDMFRPTNSFFWSLYATVSGKKMMGDDKEMNAETFFGEYATSKGIKVQLRKPTDEKDDALYGVDLVFDHNGKELTIQVKTLDHVEETIVDDVEYYKVFISGDYTELYNNETKKGVDYFVVMSTKETMPSYIFRAKGSMTMPGYYLVPKSNFVHKS